MSRASTVLERLAALEVITKEQRADVLEIKGDVKLLLEHKWKSEGKRMGVAAVIAAIVSLAVPFITR
jgi:hypothetical protein